MIAILVVLVVATLIGCAASLPPQFVHHPSAPSKETRDIPVWVDGRFTPEQAKEIDKAVEVWNLALNGHARISIVGYRFDMEFSKALGRAKRNGFLILRITSDNSIVNDSPGNVTLGLTNRIGGEWIYLVVDRLLLRDIRPVTAHEIGHILGVRHGGSGLMRSRYLQNDRWDCVDLYTALAVEESLGLPFGSVVWCEKQRIE